jgi:hypothetical protein
VVDFLLFCRDARFRRLAPALVGFQGNKVAYTMGKNKKTGSLKSPEKALALLNKYTAMEDPKNDLIFPDLRGAAKPE